MKKIIFLAVLLVAVVFLKLTDADGFEKLQTLHNKAATIVTRKYGMASTTFSNRLFHCKGLFGYQHTGCKDQNNTHVLEFKTSIGGTYNQKTSVVSNEVPRSGYITITEDGQLGEPALLPTPAQGGAP